MLMAISPSSVFEKKMANMIYKFHHHPLCIKDPVQITPGDHLGGVLTASGTCGRILCNG